MVKKFLIGFVTTVAVIIAAYTFFGWGAPMSDANSEDVNEIRAALGDSIVNIELSPLETIGDSVDCQTVKYDIYTDSNVVHKTAIVGVKKGFLKYYFDKVIKK